MYSKKKTTCFLTAAKNIHSVTENKQKMPGGLGVTKIKIRKKYSNKFTLRFLTLNIFKRT